MATRRFSANDKTAIYLLLVVVVIVAFLLLGGGAWMKGMTHGSGSVNLAQLNWIQILISFGLGILVGWLVFRRKW